MNPPSSSLSIARRVALQAVGMLGSVLLLISVGMAVVAEVSDDEAMATHWAIIYAFWALLAATTVVLGLGLFWLVRRNVSRPLAELTQAITSVAQGDLSRRFRTDRHDDIARLVLKVESMRERFLSMILKTAVDR